jgi:carbonic anhydrase/acetyltransferase-like protein (isoleucine patch superfamily)
MPLFSFEGLTPQVHATAFLAPTATLVGDVIIEEGASVWYGAVIRADYAPVIVRARANVQDNAVIHGPPGLTSDIGAGATVGHNCVVHGSILEEECIVANGSVVLDGATIGARALVAAGSVVRAGSKIPAGMLAVGTPAEVRRPVKGTGAEMWVQLNPGAYAELAQRHRVGIRFVDRPDDDND